LKCPISPHFISQLRWKAHFALINNDPELVSEVWVLEFELV
jgi:hypothetical protein